MKKSALLIGCLCLVASVTLPLAALAQQARAQEKVRDGVFEITLKSAEPRKMIVEELVRDRDLNPRALYRVKTGGYLGFDEGEWVEKIEFKVFDKPITDLPEYRAFSDLLDDINNKLWEIKERLGGYDLLALRLMNICERSRFGSLQAIDDNINQQLVIYRKLELLKQLAINSLSRYIKERSCVDPYVEYNKTLERYSKQLTELTKNYDLLARRALTLTQQMKTPERQESERPKSVPPSETPAPEGAR